MELIRIGACVHWQIVFNTETKKFLSDISYITIFEQTLKCKWNKTLCSSVQSFGKHLRVRLL